MQKCFSLINIDFVAAEFAETFAKQMHSKLLANFANRQLSFDRALKNFADAFCDPRFRLWSWLAIQRRYPDLRIITIILTRRTLE